MKIRALGMVLVMAGCAGAATRQPPSPENDPVLRLESTWAEALIRRDTTLLRQLLDTTFVLTTSAAEVTRRATYLAEAGRPSRTVEEVRFRDREVRYYGRTAVTTGEASVIGSKEDVPFSFVVRYTNVFVAAGRSWRAVSSQTTIEDYDPMQATDSAAASASAAARAAESRDSACDNPVSTPDRPAWRECVRYGGGPSVGAPPSDYTGERPPSQWCLNATGRPPGDFGFTRMTWMEASRSWLRQVLSDTTDVGEVWRSVLGGAPRLSETDSITHVMEESACHEIAEVLNRDLLGWEVGPPPVVVFGVRDYLIAFPSNARLGEFGMAVGMGLDRRIRGVASW